MRVSNIAVGLFFILFGLGLCIGASRLSIPRNMAFGPGFFPGLVGAGLIGVGLALAWQGLRERNSRAWFERPEWARTKRGWMRFFGLIGSIIFYALVCKTLGFTITAAIIGTSLLLIARVPLGRAIAVGGLMAVVMTSLFASLLKVPLPWGPFRAISGYLLW